MNEAKFQACPFCGSEPTVTDTGTHNGIRWLVRCDNALCGVNPYARSMNHDRALAIWNQRAGGREPATSQTPEPSTLVPAQGSETGEPRARTVLRSMLAAFDAGDDATYWRCAALLNSIHAEMLQTENEKADLPTPGE